jgi:cellulose biosynthesis protein BcsQ
MSCDIIALLKMVRLLIDLLKIILYKERGIVSIMKIAVANNKGGQGKTLLAILLIQHLNSEGKNVTACDLDRTQLNLTDCLQESKIKVFSRFDDVTDDSLCVIDTPPYLDENLMSVIKCVDRLIVPITLGKHAVQGVRRICELRGQQDTKFVINAYDDSTIQKQAKDFLIGQGFEFVGTIPRYKRLAYNIDCNLPWFSGFSPIYTKQIKQILNDLVR